MLDGHRPRAYAISFELLVWAPVLLFSMVAHEYAHAEAAYRQGDDTAYMLGRLTLNPLKHIDPFMTVLLPVMLCIASNGTYTFGGAKPVPVNPRNYRRFARGDLIVSLAGIAVNFALFVIFGALFAGVGIIADALPSLAPALGILQQMMQAGVWVDPGVAVFKLLPVPAPEARPGVYSPPPPRTGRR